MGGRTCSTGAKLEHTIRGGGETDAKPVTRQVRIFKVLDLVQRICFCFPHVSEVTRFLVHITKKLHRDEKKKKKQLFSEDNEKIRSNASQDINRI